MADNTTHRDDSVGEEIAATGQRVKGAVKEATGSMLGLGRMEREGERENAEGRARQAANDALGDDRVTTRDTSGRLVTGLYESPAHAGRAYQDLTTRHGYKSGGRQRADVRRDSRSPLRQRHAGQGVRGRSDDEAGSKAAEGAGIGGATGLGVGAALGALLAAASSIAIPGLGLVVAGPIAGAIAGAGAGGAAGTLMGALIGAGIPEDRAQVYDRGIREGGIVLGTRARDEAHAAELERDFTTLRRTRHPALTPSHSGLHAWDGGLGQPAATTRSDSGPCRVERSTLAYRPRRSTFDSSTYGVRPGLLP